MKTACVILAAGEGTRMKSSTPKVLHPVCGRPMIAYPVELALGRGYGPVVVVVSKAADAVRAYLRDRFGKRVRIAVQDPPLGTGHAVLSARRALDGARGKLAILYGDVPLLAGRDLGLLQRAGGKAAVAFLTCRPEDPAGYGRVVRDARGEVVRIVEHADASAAERRIGEINAGIYLVDLPFVFRALERVRRANAQGEFYLTDLVEQARARGERVAGVARDDAAAFQGVNTRAELARAEALMNRRLVERLMKSGVTVLDPATTWVGPGVRVGADTVLLPNCLLRGEVRIGRECRIGPGAVIDNARIDTGAEVRAYSVLEGCRIGEDCVVGPFARLRPGAELGAGARVGNFVEVKQSRLGKGARANHLTYLGDATVEDGANVGAGTITCNYDGCDKHATVIGEGAFIGSGTQLVAPVRIGREAVIGAGTTVTSDVPPGALAVSRVRQENIPGYARRRKKSGRHKPARG